MEYVGPILFIALVVFQYSVTGRFLTELEHDNPDKYKEVWPTSESLLAILFPFRFGLLYAIPGTYEYWNLGPQGLRLARQLRTATWFLVAAILLALVAFVASVL